MQDDSLFGTLLPASSPFPSGQCQPISLQIFLTVVTSLDRIPLQSDREFSELETKLVALSTVNNLWNLEQFLNFQKRL